MKPKSWSSFLFLIVILTSSLCFAQNDRQWKSDQVIRPENLVKELSGKSGNKPLILQVGFEVLYHGGHIPKSIWAGPASRPDGMARLVDAVKNVRHDKEIVIYCGCCPWSDCPNILPAMNELKKLGFKHVKALFIPIDFRTDWINKGYPTVAVEEKISR